MAYTSFSTITLLSFAQWLDHRLCDDGQGYLNTSSRLYYQPDASLAPGNVAYASPFRSWVCDSGVQGAIIAGSISGTLGLGGTGALTRGQSGLQFDYHNGRVILPAAVGTSAVISGSYAVKELNVYFANQSAERMVFTNHYTLNSRFNRPITGIPPPYEMVTPCVFVANEVSESEPAAFGGLYQTRHHLEAYVLAENLGQLENTLALLADSEDATFPQLPTNAVPLGLSGELKGGSGYDYSALQSQFGGPGNLYDISEVSASKVGDGVRIGQGVFLGIVSFQVDRCRTIH